MSTFLLIVQMLPMVLQIVKAIEELIAGAKQGTVKKQAAVALITESLAVAVKSGGMKASDAEKAAVHAPAVVDVAVGVLNTIGVFKHEPAIQS